MSDFKLPYGADFSPDQIDIVEVIKMASESEGEETKTFVDKLEKEYFHNKSIASNCKSSMVSYGILESGRGISLSTFGKELMALDSETEVYEAMASRILRYLNGLVYIEAIRTITTSGERPSLERLADTLNLMGCNPPVARTNKAHSTMKKWLEKAKVLEGWKIKEEKLAELAGIEADEMEVLKGLSREQVFFLRALCSADSGQFQNSAKIRDLATASFHVSFKEKNFSAKIINPLVEKKLIEKEPSVGSHGGNAPKVKIADFAKQEILAPVLEQVQSLAGNEVVKYWQKDLRKLREEMSSTDTHVKGLALEAFAIRIMQIVNLEFAGTRVKGTETAGAEVDVIFENTSLNYARWQVQCKNTENSKVSLDQVAKEVGVATVLGTNVIVILTTGKVSEKAKEYADSIMGKTNLCIMFIEDNDIDEILKDQTKIIAVLNREAQKAKQAKLLQNTGK